MVGYQARFYFVSPSKALSTLGLTKFSGDSYTSTSFNETGIQPTPTNPLGNPPYPGWTSANGPNWVDFLTVKHNKSVVLTYNIAYGGATINSALVAPYLPTVSSVADQIQNQWFPTYASKPSFAPWTSKDTLFAIFDGINDVGNSWWKGVEETTKLYANIFAVYHGLVDQLYYAGARNFAFVNVPPVDRAPLSLELTPEYQAIEKAAILAWNVLITDMAAQLKKTFPDVNVFTVDSWTLFTQVLDDPKSYPQTSGYKNVTAFCEAYKK
jgi:phospholipase/lecithinase/hemolysin